MVKDHYDISNEELLAKLPQDILEILDKRNATAMLLKILPETWTPEEVSPRVGEKKTDEQEMWEMIAKIINHGIKFEVKYPNDEEIKIKEIQGKGPHEAIPIYMALYNHMLLAQQNNHYRVHKGMPLVWISDCFLQMGFLVHAKRYLMLTLCEDALTYNQGKIDPETSGTYFRLVWQYGMSDSEFQRYSSELYELGMANPETALFPEWLLQEIDQNWMIDFPSYSESSRYFINKIYLQKMVDRLGEENNDGKNLERLGSYLLSCVPGFKSTRRNVTLSTDYDIVCTIEGMDIDFRSDIGRYFICECKDYKDAKADFSDLAKFCRVLDSTKCKFGILFSTNGITGQGRGIYAEREQLKVFQDRGLIIIVIDKNDFQILLNGGNFISLLRNRYEKVRLDLVNRKK